MNPTRADYLAEQLHRLLSGGDVTRESPWSRLELRLAVEQAMARVVKLAYWENLKADGEHTVDGQLLVPLNGLPLTYDAPIREWVAVLPGPFIGLPGGRGLARVRFTNKPAEPDLMPAPSSLLRGSRVAKALGSSYELVGLQIRVVPKCDLKTGAALDVRVVMTGGALPQEMEMAALAEALKLVQARQRPDLTNDQNPTP